MRRLPAMLIIGSLGLALSGSIASATDAPFMGGRASFKPLTGFGDRHRTWHPRRFPTFPGYLHGRGGDVNVVIQQVFVSAPVPPPIPSVLDLPAVAGIRDTLPARPTVIRVNEWAGVREPTVRALSGGPKILKDLPGSQGGEHAQPAPSGFGARIVHLTVPVGR